MSEVWTGVWRNKNKNPTTQCGEQSTPHDLQSNWSTCCVSSTGKATVTSESLHLGRVQEVGGEAAGEVEERKQLEGLLGPEKEVAEVAEVCGKLVCLGWKAHCLSCEGWKAHCLSREGWKAHCLSCQGWKAHCLSCQGWKAHCLSCQGWKAHCLSCYRVGKPTCGVSCFVVVCGLESPRNW